MKVKKIHHVCITILLFLFLLFGIQLAIWAQVDSDGDLNADVTDPSPNDPNQGGIYPGAVITYDVLMAGDLDATGFTGTVITIAADGVTFDGNGHKIIAPDASQGITVQYAQDVPDDIVELTGVVIIAPNTGLKLYGVTESTISWVTSVGPGGYGIVIYESADNLIKDCTLSGRNRGIFIVGSISTNNIIRNNDLSQCSEAVNAVTSSPAGNEFLDNNCSESDWGLSLFEPAEISGNDLRNCSSGCLRMGGYSSSSPVGLQDVLTGNDFTGSALALSLSSVVSGTTISDLDFTGIDVTRALVVANSEGITLSNLTLPVTGTGLHLYGVTESTISGIISVGPGNYGIHMGNCSDNVIENCTLSGHNYGIDLHNSSDNTLTGNTVSNSSYGLYFTISCINNQIYSNNFIDNATQAYVGTGNVFNLDKPIGGNYWSDWTEPDADGDGFVDSPYVFTGGQDNLPCTHAHVSWNNPNGGNWDIPGNWNIGMVPGATDDVFITLNGTYTVTLNGSKSINSLTIGGATGGQTLLIQGSLANSHARLESASGFTNAGTITLDSIDTGWNSTLTVSDGTLTNQSGGVINVNPGCGEKVSSDLYFYHLQAGSYNAIKRMLIVK